MISVIIPVFNCRPYLSQCIESVLNQTYKDIELILVDDGSTDGSAAICDEYGQKDSRIKTIHKKNGGVSSARNAGLHVVSGEYVLFVDADDWLDLDACKRINLKLRENVQIYFWKAVRVSEYGITERVDIKNPDSVDTLFADIIASPKGQNSDIRAPWAKVFSREILENIQFPEDVYIGEDACMILSCLNKIDNVNQIAIVNDSWYNYRIVATSAVRRYKSDLLEQSLKQYQYILNQIILHKSERSQAVMSALTDFCWNMFVALKMNEMKGEKSANDCKKWWKVTQQHLINDHYEQNRISKFHMLCMRIGKVFGVTVTELLTQIYVSVKQ